VKGNSLSLSLLLERNCGRRCITQRNHQDLRNLLVFRHPVRSQSSLKYLLRHFYNIVVGMSSRRQIETSSVSNKRGGNISFSSTAATNATATCQKSFLCSFWNSSSRPSDKSSSAKSTGDVRHVSTRCFHFSSVFIAGGNLCCRC